MSTKTSIKRIALVAVSALGFGLLSVAPSNAAALNAPANPFVVTVPVAVPGTNVISTSTGYTVLQTASSDGYVQLSADADVAGATNVKVTVTGGSITTGGGAGATCTNTVTGQVNYLTKTYSAGTFSGSVLQNGGGYVLGDCTAAFGANQAITNFRAAFVRIGTPTAGTITATVTATVVDGNGVSTTTVLQVFNIIVSGAGSSAVTSSRVTMAGGTSATDYYNAIEGVVYAPKTQDTNSAAVVTVTQYAGAVAAANTSAKAVSASITGVGSFSGTAGVYQSYIQFDAATLAVRPISVYADGRAGKSVVTVSVDGVVVGSRTINFYGDAAKIEVLGLLTTARATSAGAQLGSIEKDVAGVSTALVGVEGTSTTPLDPGDTNNPSLAVLVTDANGIPVPVVPTAASSDSTVVASCAVQNLLDSGAGANSVGTYYQHISIQSAPMGVSGKSATCTFSTITPAGVIVSSTPVKITLGGLPSTVTMTADKASYRPGEAGTITVTSKDSVGNASYDGATLFLQVTESTGLFGGKRPTAASTTVGGTKTFAFFAPAVSGTYSITGLRTDGATLVTLPITVSGGAAEDAANAAADAAAEAIDAANAATDAANLAAEAADAATVAAEEARDAADAATAAVEELAQQVATLMAALKAQITTLANTVAKIAKKVRA